MMTFLPYADFARSAGCLDARRLGKQRVEAWQIERALLGLTRGWVRHPAVALWRGYLPALRLYRSCCIREWVRRGYRNTMPLDEPAQPPMPWWLGDEALHASHRANLLRKDPDFYGRYGWSEDPAIGYRWPQPAQGAMATVGATGGRGRRSRAP